ncbi:MAG TPA: dihydrolipoamide acetyltransferase family protein [Candidatus Hydrogenedentes bacterium]|jgi:pyruvate dehydrogenase E2 component (dihydrolipoamide acetyltransferase)|nr:dihydrolipoamide acetyltransferase family protein [Candidatus Hydrogenedentota bacterium]HPJ99712.1 dihydrolipoamide acetyltransferase family protein [Candidatus Hydrogenedentota bacterium]
MHEIRLPQLGQSVEEASIVEWRKKEGDPVKTGEVLFTVQTDKAEIECESTADGILRKILVVPDVEVAVMTVVALVGEADEPLPDLAQYSEAAPETAPAPSASSPAPAPPSAPATPAVQAPAEAPAAPAQEQAPGGRTPVSPRARKRAEQLKVDPAFAQGSGAGGRVMEADVEVYAAQVALTPTARQLVLDNALDATRIKGTGPGGKITKADVQQALASPRAAASPMVPGEVQRVPLTPMRRIIAERMAASKFSAPHYYITVEVDMAAAMAFRRGCTEFKPSVNDLVLRAAALAIQQHPQVNARWAGDAIELAGDINLGFAVAMPAGLIVPVVRQAQTKTLKDISRECSGLAEKARAGKLLPDDYAGNTFTVSNLGAFGVDQFTAIINQPDSAILAVGQIKGRPVVIEGGIYVRPIMKMTLSSDHRVIDGAVAAQFMKTLKGILEDANF